MRIECDRCVLREWNPGDVESLVENANNYSIASHMRDQFPSPYTLEDGKSWIKVTSYPGKNFFLAITLEDVAVGGIGLTLGEDIERISAEVGYWLGEKYWGKGITSSAIKGIVEYGFNNLGLERIFAKPFEHNTASRKVLEKNGFKLEGIMEKSCIKNGKICNQVLYAITKNYRE
ncbi:GNAT family N-acetyltransferase [Methanobacterium sp. MZ-A1]|uniref:GNAT family N-acetyltransferase n=1 Tax=Methanobacterium sp. MZ-A1 TaxID=1911685 RepID=UPI000C2D2BAB|nr:GNAT family N-acetyltransferase [Methanobacterium sp. MZ-A1]AUB58593.1 GNAT family N-acetyltransferase [Methanobacterium sp. MZ-A1]